ncbi:MAG TPA: universal stress protein [Nitrospira sp.]|nr:universal stress protein [Nitrospira sp.]
MTFMINRLLLATDFSPWARRAEEYACSLAASWRAHLTVMTVLEFPPGMNPDYPVNQQYLTERMGEASRLLAEFKGRATKRGIIAATRIATGLPSEEVNAAALAEESDLVIVGTRGKSGLAHVLLGSTAERVIRTGPCPVLAVHMAADESSVEPRAVTLERMLVPIDFSDCSLDALEFAAVVARQAKASIELVHVLEPVSYGLDFTLSHAKEREQEREKLSKRLQDLSSALSKAEITVKSRLRGGVPADSILDDARSLSCDLIVMGTHGRRGLSHVMAGSVAEAVLRRAQCPVLTVRSPKFSPSHRRLVSSPAMPIVNH